MSKSNTPFWLYFKSFLRLCEQKIGAFLAVEAQVAYLSLQGEESYANELREYVFGPMNGVNAQLFSEVRSRGLAPFTI